MLRTRTTTVVAAVAASVISLAVAGCTVSTTSSAPGAVGAVSVAKVDSTARDYVIAGMVDRANAQDGVWPEQSLADLLPRHRFRLNGAKAEPLAEGIVVGTVTDVQPGEAYMIVGSDAAAGTEVAFDDPRALWRVIELTISTDTRLGDVNAKTIRVGVVIDGGMDVATATAGYLGLGRIALVLNEPGKFDFDPDLYSVRESGTLFGLVSKHGEISFPALGGANDDFVGALDTVTAVVDEAADVAPVVAVTTDGGELVRSDDK
jgi:hypothetical protein